MKLSIIIPVYNQEELVIKALDCIPRREDIEVLVCDDASTDSTLANLLDYMVGHPELNLHVYSNAVNRGVAYTKNRLIDDAMGEYLHFHDSDDHVDTALYNSLIDGLNGADVYVMNLVINSGKRYNIRPKNSAIYCAQIARFIRKAFADGIRFPEHIRAGDDGYYAVELANRKPVTVYTGVPAYFYNYPRDGSLTDLRIKGIIQ